MKVVNFFAGPGGGKSTGAAYVFSKLKLAGVNTELVTEYAKRKVYEKSFGVLENQVYLTGKQYKTVKDLQNYGVGIAISDSPLLLGLFYARGLGYYKEYSDLLVRLSQEFENINVFVKRVKVYNPSGRTQTEEESDAVSLFLKNTIGIDVTINGDQEGYDGLIKWLAVNRHI